MLKDNYVIHKLCSCGNAVKGERRKIFYENFLSLVYLPLTELEQLQRLFLPRPSGRGLPSAGEADSFFFSPEFFFSQKKILVAVRRRRNAPCLAGKRLIKPRGAARGSGSVGLTNYTL